MVDSNLLISKWSEYLAKYENSIDAVILFVRWVELENKTAETARLAELEAENKRLNEWIEKAMPLLKAARDEASAQTHARRIKSLMDAYWNL